MAWLPIHCQSLHADRQKRLVRPEFRKAGADNLQAGIKKCRMQRVLRGFSGNRGRNLDESQRLFAPAPQLRDSLESRAKIRARIQRAFVVLANGDLLRKPRLQGVKVDRFLGRAVRHNAQTSRSVQHPLLFGILTILRSAEDSEVRCPMFPGLNVALDRYSVLFWKDQSLR